MKKIRQEKTVSSLPSILEPNTIYYVRIEGGFDIYITNDIGTIVAYPVNKYKDAFIEFNSRFYFYTNRRWVGTSNLYSQSWHNANQNFGTGNNPNILWQNLGIAFLPQGTILRNLEFIGRVNNAQVTDIEIQLSIQGDNLDTGGYDSNNESNNEVILSPTLLGSSAPNFADIQRHVVSLNNYVLQRDALIIFCCRPIGNLSGTRYWYARRSLHYTMP